MKKITTMLMGLTLLAGGSLMAAEQGMEGMNHGDKAMQMKMSDEYCVKHCNVMDLRKDLQGLEKKIEADKTAITNPGTSGKILSIEARKNELKKDLDQLVEKQIALKKDLDKAQQELADLEKK